MKNLTNFDIIKKTDKFCNEFEFHTSYMYKEDLYQKNAKNKKILKNYVNH